MKTTLRTDITVAGICAGFVYNQLEGKGLFGLGGKLTIQPEYQRNYIYAEEMCIRDRNSPLSFSQVALAQQQQPTVPDAPVPQAPKPLASDVNGPITPCLLYTSCTS